MARFADIPACMFEGSTLIRLVIADDHELIREGIKKIVRHCADLKVVGEAADLKQATALIAQLRPDLVVLDVTLPDADGLEGLAALRRHFPGLRIVMLSMHPEERYAVEALRAGALGYVSKGAATVELVEALRRAGQGTPWVGPRVAELLAGPAAPPADAARRRNRGLDRRRPPGQAGCRRTRHQHQFGQHLPQPDLPQDGAVLERGADPLRVAPRPGRLMVRCHLATM
jgi:DNA-binding NarL/FixJ family response regulator